MESHKQPFKKGIASVTSEYTHEVTISFDLQLKIHFDHEYTASKKPVSCDPEMKRIVPTVKEVSNFQDKDLADCNDLLKRTKIHVATAQNDSNLLQHDERTVSDSDADEIGAIELDKTPSESPDGRAVEVENTCTTESATDDLMPSPTDKTNNKKSDKFHKQLMDYIPQNYNYMIENFQEIANESFLGAPPFAFEVHLWLEIDTAIDVQTWIQQLEEKTTTTYRVTKGTSYRMTGKKVVYKTIRHCQHKQKKPTKKMTQSARDIKFGAPKEGCERSTRDKKTGCPSTLSATVLARGSTLKYPQYPCFVKLSFNHNHPLDSGHALSFRPVSVATKDAYMHLFENGNSAYSARHEYVRYLQLEHDGKTDIQRLLADRSTNPNVQDVQRLFRKWRQSTVGAENGKAMFEKLEDEVERYNKTVAADGGRAYIQRYTVNMEAKQDRYSESQEHAYSKPKAVQQQVEKPFILAIITPLMARAHRFVR